MRALAAAALCLALAGCGLSGTAGAIAPDVAARAVGEATGVQLRRVPPPDTAPTLSNLMGSYVDARGASKLLLLVFDSPAATRQVLPRTAVAGAVRQGNVVVLFLPGGVRPETVRDALRRAG